MNLDKINVSTQWSDEIKTDMGQRGEYVSFRDLGKDDLEPVQQDKKWDHLVYDFKNYGYHKAGVVADGNLADIPVGSVYYKVFSLCGIQLLVFNYGINEI